MSKPLVVKVLTPSWALEHLKSLHSGVVEDIDTLGAFDILEEVVDFYEKAHNSGPLIKED